MRKAKYLIAIIVFTFTSNNSALASGSILNTGSWYKFNVSETGLYKITYEQLQNIGFTNLNNIKIYGNGGKALPLSLQEERVSEVQEIVFYNSNTTGNFEPGDYLIVYLEGSVTWQYSPNTTTYLHEKHPYTNNISYFLTTSKGKATQIKKRDYSTQTVSYTTSQGDFLYVHEENLVNLINSGRIWFGERLDKEPFSSTVNIPNINTSSSVKISGRIAGRFASRRSVDLQVNNSSSAIPINAVSITSKYGEQAKDTPFSLDFDASSSVYNLTFSAQQNSEEEYAYLDYYNIEARINLAQPQSTPLIFSDKFSFSKGASKYNVSGLNSEHIVLNISNVNDVYQLHPKSGYFVDYDNGSLSRFAIFKSNNNFNSVDFNNAEGWIASQNLTGTSSSEMIIVSHENFLEQAHELAQFHREIDNLSVFVTTPEKIYNEFSSGNRDVAAIRDYMHLQYQKSLGKGNQLKYLMLIGDGSYNNHMDIEGNTNFIPTYQSLQSVKIANGSDMSYTSDDFYTLLGDNEGSVNVSTSTNRSDNLIGDMDISVGRLPVKTIEQANAVVAKIKEYYNALGDWRLRIALLGDTGDASWDQTIFMTHSEEIAEIIESKNGAFDIKKVYLHAYEPEASASGVTFPEARNNILDYLDDGVLIFNYIGHGGESGMSTKKILLLDDFNKLSNGPFYPLIITASCQVGRFEQVETKSKDNISEVFSASEAAFLNDKGGAIALFTTSRLVYEDQNHALSEQFFKALLTKDENGEYPRLGDAYRISKNAVSNENKLNFMLMGNPALKLAIPEKTIITDSINNKIASTANPDTLKAFDMVEFSGYIADSEGKIDPNYNGTVYVKVYDRPSTIATNGYTIELGDSTIPLTFENYSTMLFRGRASVTNGRYNLKFRMPKEISYSYKQGKITIYAEDEYEDASGYSRDFVVGGSSNYNEVEYDGPEIKLYMNDTLFEDNDITNNSPELYAIISDETGINITGSGIGHDLNFIMNDDFTNQTIVNDYYYSFPNDYTSGDLRYKLRDLEPGEHKITFEAWDLHNNSSEAELYFTVVDGNSLSLTHLLNYPNPFTESTQIQYNHNAAGEEHEVDLSIFNINGQLIYNYRYTNFETSYVSTPITWNRNTNFGHRISPGIYPYRIIVRTESGKSAIINQKFIIR